MDEDTARNLLDVYMNISAILVEVEGMKAFNQERLLNESSVAYVENDFQAKANEIKSFNNQIWKRF